jgi:hypothetical protein
LRIGYCGGYLEVRGGCDGQLEKITQRRASVICTLPYNIKMIKSIKIISEGHVSCMRNTTNVQGVKNIRSGILKIRDLLINLGVDGERY